ncbi:hypothetical protein GRX01_04760 [Halobaculum sp. WSA2]|uniref:Uncharacterized protein n=1 Tax=Halobaculum saliterrae TaxID=2073113 RepID=A0A6B0T298_9EURY|nr:hypothetical protein [Halobaculum saliterrae]MXR40659.1 hypothetical protein [Halobaculum saliterrae]
MYLISIYHCGATEPIAYAPDMESFVTEPPTTDIDLFVCEGSPFVGHNHLPADRLEATIADLDAERTVLVNASEHARREHTVELEEHADAIGCELSVDFNEYTIP